jgi:signal transduction histidine kinase
MSLGIKIMVFVVLLVGVTLAALSGVVLQLEYEHLTNEAHQQAAGYLRSFAQTVDTVDWSKGRRPKRELARAAASAFNDPNVVYVALQDKNDGILFATQDAGDVATAIHRTLTPGIRKYLKRTGFYTRPALQIGDEPVIELMAQTKGERVARLGLREEETRVAVNKFAEDALKRLILINSMAVVAAFLLAFFFARSVQNPLRAVRARLAETLGGDASGNGFSGTSKDELEHLQAEADAIQKLVRSLESKPSEVVGTLSHEFRSPLQAILGYTGLIKQGKAGAITKRAKEYLEAIEESAVRFKSFTDSALDLVRLEKGKLETARAPFDFTPLAKGAARLFAPDARFGEITLKTQMAHHLWALGDGDRTYQVLLNLISNACKFTPDGGKIDVTAKVEGPLIHVCVADSGAGIPAEDLERVFQKFYQSKGQRLRGGKGVGLGLTLAKAVIEAQGGKIWIESELGNGTKVHFTLPKVLG